MLFDVLRAIIALAFTLGLVALGAYALRRWGPGGLLTLAAPRAERRMSVIETLILDPSRRLVLVKLDGRERLLLLGEGRLLAELPAAPACIPAPVPAVSTEVSA
jgi:flagellar protein FliO/FliZ